jgi:hypothetical protein
MFRNDSCDSRGVVLAGPLPQRQCYVCGRDAVVSILVGPFLVPVCFRAECKPRAQQLPGEYRSIRLMDRSPEQFSLPTRSVEDMP